ncbi:unnamed protein product [Lactuca virosa]|uniref:Uncharacterized protein n=1 Tax=Lactuca virosa TaxID=75947 RepID=A0AAU9NKS9_9ASTR|nr:unnamed protein product [Lactuca virosa]
MGKHKVSKKGKPIVCSACHMPGHNKVTCPTTNKPVKLRVKRAKITKTTQVKGGGVHGSVNGGTGGVHGGEGGGVHGVQKKKVRVRGVGVVFRTRKPSERILNTKLAKAVYGKNGEGNSTTNAVDID